MKGLKLWGASVMASLICLSFHPTTLEAGVITAGKSHIGTFEGSTTFTTSSANGINPGLFLEVRDADGQLKQYTSEEGVITVPNTKEGAYVTQAKLLGKTKYVDQDTGETLDTWEEGRNLRLESVQMPVLTTTGKNLVDNSKNSNVTISSSTGIATTNLKSVATDYIRINQKPYSRCFVYGSVKGSVARFYDKDKNFIGTTYSEDCYYVRYVYSHTEEIAINDVQYMAAYSADIIAGNYEPYKSNILSTSEDVILRGIGGVKDELDLLTGEVTQRIEEIVLDASSDEDWYISVGGSDTHTRFIMRRGSNLKPISYVNRNSFLCDKFKSVTSISGTNSEEMCLMEAHDNFFISIIIDNTKLNSVDVDGFKLWMQSNPVKFNYVIEEESIKTVDLTSTYEFNLVSDGVVQVKGEVIPTIYSVTVPSEPLTFAINPNAEEGQQFIAPDFSITNEGKGPVELELKSFTQKTSVLNDVLPEKYPDWTLLDKRESRDIALALIPKPSDAWLSLTEGPKYVANTSSTIIGKVKPGETVDFSFSAKHGTVFDQNLFPEYQLVFTFGF